jgi:hypothetical protein
LVGEPCPLLASWPFSLVVRTGAPSPHVFRIEARRRVVDGRCTAPMGACVRACVCVWRSLSSSDLHHQPPFKPPPHQPHPSPHQPPLHGLGWATRAAAQGNEAKDAAWYATQGVDYVKVCNLVWRTRGAGPAVRPLCCGARPLAVPCVVGLHLWPSPVVPPPLGQEDSCNAPQSPHQVAFAQYAAMRDGLNATGRPTFFSLCGWNEWYAPCGTVWALWWQGTPLGDTVDALPRAPTETPLVLCLGQVLVGNAFSGQQRPNRTRRH